MTQLVSDPSSNRRRSQRRLALIVALLVAVQALGALFFFGTRNSFAWFGTGHCTMAGGFVPGQKCMAADTINGADHAQQPYKGEIIFPHGTTSISDHVVWGGSHALSGSYELQLLEDEGGHLNVYQTLDYVVNPDGSTSPASFTLNDQVLHKAFVEHPVGNGGLIGYFLFISGNPQLPASALCQNTVAFSGSGSLGSGTSAGNVLCGSPTPIPNTGKLSGHIYDCSSGVADTSADVPGGMIAVIAGPVTKAAAPNPIANPLSPAGDYTESATPPPTFHFVFNCGGTTSGTDTAAIDSVHVPVGGEGAGIFYVVHNTGTVIGHIYDCTGGTANEVSDIAGPGASIAVEDANGVPLKPASAIPVTYQMASGDYKEVATAPAHFHLVACNGVSDSSVQPVHVPSGGIGEAKFYVARDTGDLAAHIHDCSSGTAAGNDIAGGKVSAAGATPIAQQSNPLNPTTVDTDTYKLTATNPAGYHFVYTCGGSSQGSDTSATESVDVPLNGHGVANFYVARDQGQLAGHIWDCPSGSKTDVSGGMLSASGPQTINSSANPLSPTTVPTGSYTVTAVAPAGFHFVACNGTDGSGTQRVSVLKGGVASVVFYVTSNPAGGSQGTSAGNNAGNSGGTAPATSSKPVSAAAVLGAAITNPITGRGAVLRAAVLSLVLLVIGAAVLVLTRHRRVEEGAGQKG